MDSCILFGSSLLELPPLIAKAAVQVHSKPDSLFPSYLGKGNTTSLCTVPHLAYSRRLLHPSVPLLLNVTHI